MISVLSTTDKYILQPSLVGMHRESLEWASAISLWKRELTFFQKLLDMIAPKSSDVEFKKEVDHFQHIITYYDGEVVDALRKKLRNHENDLARMLQEVNEADVIYFKEHKEVMGEVSAFSQSFTEFKNSFFLFAEKYLSSSQH